MVGIVGVASCFFSRVGAFALKLQSGCLVCMRLWSGNLSSDFTTLYGASCERGDASGYLLSRENEEDSK